MMDYKKYKWFFTKSGKLVVGGKSAESNDALLRELKKNGKDYVVMHTKSPGSPFCAIISEIKKLEKSDIEECAIFTGCFSKAWKQGLKKTSVDIFQLSQLNKSSAMKSGTWSVTGKIPTRVVNLKLVLIVQENFIRAVPEITAEKNKIMFVVYPGKVDKGEVIKKNMFKDLNKEQLLSALPAGGVDLRNG